MNTNDAISISVVSGDAAQASQSLVERMYGWRGYNLSVKSDVYKARTIVISASQHGEVKATLTIAFDGFGGLNVDSHFPQEVDILRLRPHFLCEFTKLANSANDLHIVGALFHSAVLMAHNVKRASYVLIEVHPRHVAYYKRMLGFKVLADPAHNATVNATAVLLGKSFKQIERCIRYAQDKRTFGHRSMYPYFFDRAKEHEILLLLKKH